MEGDVGAADAAFPELQTAVESTKGFHQWLWSIRISTARAEAALLGGRPDRAEEHAREALAYAERIGRRKYVCRARTALGQALLELGRLDDAVGSLEGAAAEADALGHLPVGVVVAGSAGAGGGGARADDAARAASDRARADVETFASGLSEPRRDLFSGRPEIAALRASR